MRRCRSWAWQLGHSTQGTTNRDVSKLRTPLACDGVTASLDIGSLGVNHIEKVDESGTFPSLCQLIHIGTAACLGE